MYYCFILNLINFEKFVMIFSEVRAVLDFPQALGAVPYSMGVKTFDF